jgi:hypothetical protein
VQSSEHRTQTNEGSAPTVAAKPQLLHRGCYAPSTDTLEIGATLAVRQVVVSDISGKDIEDGQGAVLVVSDHPALGGRTVELDADISEVEKLESSKLTMVSVEVRFSDGARKRIILDAANFDKLFGKGTDVAEILQSARRGGAPEAAPRRRGRPAATRATTSKPGKIDYTDEDHFGQLHRGRVTEAEAALVRDNLDQANRNRSLAGQPPIDPEGAADKKRYGLSS